MELDAAPRPTCVDFQRMGTMRLGRSMALAAMLALASAPAAAQDGCTLPPRLAGGDSTGALVIIRASANIRELRFESRPRAEVRTEGCAGLDSVIVTERVNLPDPVQPGVTYRDVRVGIEIRASLNVACLLPALAADPAFAGLCSPAPTASAASPPPAGAPATPPRR
jgi:hypothetical protein